MARPITLPKPRLRGLVASATKVGKPEPGESSTSKRLTADWQDRAFMYVYLVPEINFGSRFYSRMLRKIKIYPSLLNDDGTTTRITDGPPVDILNRIQDPGGGISSILGSYGRLMFITGEGYLLGVDLGTAKEKWQFVWNKELQFDDDGSITWKRTSSGAGKKYTRARAEAYRMWMPAPDESGAAESPLRANLEIAEELVLLSRAVRGTAVARMVNGLLKIPAELSFGSEVPGADADPENNPYLREMLDHFLGVNEAVGTPEGALPFMTEGAAEFLAQLEWMALHDPQTDYAEQALRKELIERLSYGLDMPPEALRGMTDANHWTAKQVMHDMWRSHGAGVAEQFVDDLSEAYLRPALRQLKDPAYEDWSKVVVEYDDSDVVISPDRTEDARQLLQFPGMVKYTSVRKLSGMTEDMAPDVQLDDSEEMQLQLAIRFRDAGLLPKKLLPEGYVPQSQQPRGPVPDPEGPTPDASDGPPDERGDSGVSRRESRSLAIQGAARMAVIRCRETAGAKIRSKAVGSPSRDPKSPEVAALIDGRPNHLVAAIVGPERAKEHTGEDGFALVRGGSDGFRALCKDEHLDESQTTSLAQVIEIFSGKTLFDLRVPDLPSGFAAQVLRAIEVSEAMEQEIVDRNNESLRELQTIIGRAVLGV